MAIAQFRGLQCLSMFGFPETWLAAAQVQIPRHGEPGSRGRIFAWQIVCAHLSAYAVLVQVRVPNSQSNVLVLHAGDLH